MKWFEWWLLCLNHVFYMLSIMWCGDCLVLLHNMHDPFSVVYLLYKVQCLIFFCSHCCTIQILTVLLTTKQRSCIVKIDGNMRRRWKLSCKRAGMMMMSSRCLSLDITDCSIGLTGLKILLKFWTIYQYVIAIMTKHESNCK